VRLLVTGETRSGKTSWCIQYVDSCRKRGSSIGGIVCPATERQGRRTGFNVIDLLTGEEVLFARLSRVRHFRGGERVGDFTISRRGISFACAAIERALRSNCDLMVIDEVGPLELSGKGLMPAVELALASQLNLLIVVRSSLREAIQRYFPQYEFVVVADLSQSRQNVSEIVDCGSHEASGTSHPWKADRFQK